MESNRSMRIISGKFKGKTINYTKSNTTRPLKDSVKENIFNIITHSKNININIDKSKIVDLYSGTGSFGLECISRGAKGVVFVERDLEALNILKLNLRMLSNLNNIEVYKDEAINIKKFYKRSKFNILFLDPPYKDNDFIEVLKIIKKNKFFYNDHIVVVHRDKKSSDNFQNLIKVLITKIYGRSKVIFGKFN